MLGNQQTNFSFMFIRAAKVSRVQGRGRGGGQGLSVGQEE